MGGEWQAEQLGPVLSIRAMKAQHCCLKAAIAPAMCRALHAKCSRQEGGARAA